MPWSIWRILGILAGAWIVWSLLNQFAGVLFLLCAVVAGWRLWLTASGGLGSGPASAARLHRHGVRTRTPLPYP